MKPAPSGVAIASRRVASGSAASRPSIIESIGPITSSIAASSTKVMPATCRSWPTNAVSRADQPSPGRRSTRSGPSSTTRIQATTNMVAGMTSSTFSIRPDISVGSVTAETAMRSSSDRIHGMVTRWKNSPRRAKKKPKLSDRISPTESRISVPPCRRC